MVGVPAAGWPMAQQIALLVVVVVAVVAVTAVLRTCHQPTQMVAIVAATLRNTVAPNNNA